MHLFTMLPSALTALLLLLTTTDFAQAARNPPNSVLLSKVQTLTVRKDAKTSHRRVSAIPQLKCVGGNARGLYEVDVMRCTNSGSGYDVNDVEWTCKAQLPPEFKLGSTEVVCEGYDSPDDPYILKGSCGVEYRLILTEAGEEKYGKKSSWRPSKDSKDTSGDSFSWEDLYTIIFWIIFLTVLFWILSAACSETTNAGNRPRQPRGGGWGGFGGGGGGDGNDPPPPYTPRPPRKPYPSSSGSGEGWRPGFWSGAAGGAAAGYAAGRMAAGNNQRTPEYPQRGGGWFNANVNAGPSNVNTARRSDSDSSPSSSRYESTGFGSTRRR